MDEENEINDKLKIMKFLFLPCGFKHTLFIIIIIIIIIIIVIIIIIIIVIIIIIQY